MGSNNLKAVAVYRTGKISVADPDKIKEINRQIAANIKNNPGARGFQHNGNRLFNGSISFERNSPVKTGAG